MNKANNVGFTLIELLVVVLIIGILAAIALPQYTKAVERSRMAEAVQVLGDWATAQSIYYMQHNNFAAGLTDLNNNGDITVPTLENNNTWTPQAFSVAANDARVTMTLQRAGGMYAGGQVSITVENNGAIDKTCNANGADTAFCTVAGSMGYSAS